MKKARIGVIGAGAMGRYHVRVYSELKEAELVAIADPSPNAKKVAEEYETKYYEDYAEMLKKENLDGVSVAVPTTLHYKVAKYCLEKGVNVLVEKPITSEVKDAEELKKIAEEKNLLLTVGFVERFNPGVQKFIELLKDGKLGKLYAIRSHRRGPFPPRIKDVGVVVDLAVHDLDIITQCDKNKIKRIYAETARNVNSKYEDILFALMRFSDGVIASVDVDWLSPKKIRNIGAIGEKGSLWLDYITQDLYYYPPRKNGSLVRELIEVRKIEPLKNELSHFISCIIDKRQPEVTAEEGVLVLKLAKEVLKDAYI